MCFDEEPTDLQKENLAYYAEEILRVILSDPTIIEIDPDAELPTGTFDYVQQGRILEQAGFRIVKVVKPKEEKK